MLSECLSVTLTSHTPGEEEQDGRDQSKYFSLSQTLGQEQVFSSFRMPFHPHGRSDAGSCGWRA